jgi:hypothetical protein
VKRTVLPALAVALGLGGLARAAAVRGTVTLSPESRAPESSGSWRVENGVLPVTSRALDRGELMVVLDGGPPKESPPPTITVELHGMRLDPRMVVTTPGATLSIKNSDRVPHTLYADSATSVIPAQPMPVGQTRTVKIDAIGQYRIRDQEYPHVEGTVLITLSPYAASVDDKGAFKIEAPEGKYTLRVFWRGLEVVTQPLDVGSRTTEVAISVPAPKRGTRGD